MIKCTGDSVATVSDGPQNSIKEAHFTPKNYAKTSISGHKCYKHTNQWPPSWCMKSHGQPCHHAELSARAGGKMC